MLCQLVCVDRRYQRMNCFNIRELQGNLKRKFFSDLVNSNDHRELLSNTMIGLRFKNNDAMSLNSDVFSFYQYGTNINDRSRNASFINSYCNNSLNPQTPLFTSFNKMFMGYFTLEKPGYFFSQLLLLINELEMQLFKIVSNLKLFSLFNTNNFNIHLSFFISSFFNFNLNYYFNYTFLIKENHNNSISKNNTIFFKSDNNVNSSIEQQILYSGIENSSYVRSNKFMNSFVSYDYKCGNYLGI